MNPVKRGIMLEGRPFEIRPLPQDIGSKTWQRLMCYSIWLLEAWKMALTK